MCVVSLAVTSVCLFLHPVFIIFSAFLFSDRSANSEVETLVCSSTGTGASSAATEDTMLSDKKHLYNIHIYTVIYIREGCDSLGKEFLSITTSAKRGFVSVFLAVTKAAFGAQKQNCFV